MTNHARRRREQPTPDPDEAVGGIQLLVTCDPLTQQYILALEVNEDSAYELTPEDAARHVHAVHRAAAAADYDAAVLAQLTARDLDGPAMGALVMRLREGRPPINWPTPLTLVPGVSGTTRRPFLTLHHHGQPIGQWKLSDAHQHATGVMEVVCAVDLDTQYRQALIDDVHLEPDTAGAVVAGLIEHRIPA